MTEFSDAGAYRDVKISYRSVRLASDIRINDYIAINGKKPCRRVLVAVVSSLGKDAIYGVEVDQTGSAIRIKPNEDAVNQRITKDSDVVVNQSKTKNSDVAKKACLNEEATKALLSLQPKTKEGARCANLSTAKYGYEYTQRSYRDAVLGHNATGEDRT